MENSHYDSKSIDSSTREEIYITLEDTESLQLIWTFDETDTDDEAIWHRRLGDVSKRRAL